MRNLHRHRGLLALVAVVLLTGQTLAADPFALKAFEKFEAVGAVKHTGSGWTIRFEVPGIPELPREFHNTILIFPNKEAEKQFADTVRKSEAGLLRVFGRSGLIGEREYVFVGDWSALDKNSPYDGVLPPPPK